MKRLVSAALLAAVGVGMAFGQNEPPGWHRFNFDVGGGFTNPVGATGRNLDNGWNIQAGAGVRVGFMDFDIDLGYSAMGINSATLASFGAPGGNVNIFSATFDPKIHLLGHRAVDVYVMGGGGIFHRYQNFTQPTVGFATVYDPFFGFFSTAFPANQVISSYTVNRPGFDVGAGVALGTRHGKIFMEAKWDRILLNNYGTTDYLPVTFGLRW